MAITRCPYCRAIIDEKAEYCSNCGTQLLFPEDESAEEEIPGEKIIDDELEEKDYEIDEPREGMSKALTSGDGEDEDDDAAAGEEAGDDDDDEDGDEEKSGLLDKGESEDIDEDDEEEEVIIIDEPVEEEHIEKEKETESVTPKSDEEPGPKEYGLPFPDLEISTRIIRLEKSKIREVFPGKPKKTEETIKPEPLQAAPGTSQEAIPEPERDEEPEKAEEAVKPPMTFDTRELDKIGHTSDAGSDQLEKILDAFRDKEGPADIPKPRIPSTDSLPPWAGRIAEPPGDLEDEEDRDEEERESEDVQSEAVDEEDEYEETGTPREAELDIKRRAADSGIGLPERPAQDQLPLDRVREKTETPPERKPAVEEPPGWREEAEEEAYETEVEGRPFHLTSFLKAKLFDVLFIGVFWLVSLWLASRSMDVSLFQVLAVAGTSSLIFLGVLLVSYFFLFYFFLRETLGDRLFRERD